MADGDDSSSEGEEELEALQGIPWPYHPVRKLLLEKLISGEIPGDYRKMGAQYVWNKYCDLDIFAGMEYDEAFKRRLRVLRKQFVEGKSWADEDLQAFIIAKTNHLPPPRNHKNEPQWNGSAAQAWLKVDMENEKHIDTKPEHLWESRGEYQEFYLSTFRDHLHQAKKN